MTPNHPQTMKKYELTEETKTLPDGTVLHRIRAVREFTLSNGAIVTPGTIGGWVEKEKNLSHENNAWVGGDASVYGAARVCGSACVGGSASVYEFALVGGDAFVLSDAEVCGDANIFGSARVHGEACVYQSARVYGDAEVCGKACVGGDADVCGAAVLRKTVKISNTTDYITAGPTGSRESFTTYCIAADLVFCGCFSGTLEQFAAAVEKTHAAQPEYLAQYRAMIAYFSTLRSLHTK